MGLGRLANGTHTIVVRVRDNAGNERVHSIEHVANQDAYTPPSHTGLFAITTPSVVYEDGSFHVIALAVRDGRPLAGQRFELLPPRSSTAIAGKNAAADGSVDMLVEHAVEGPLLLTMPGSGLAPVTIEYTYHAKGSPPFCEQFADDAACVVPTTGGDHGPTSGGDNGGSSGTSGDGSSSTTNNTTSPADNTTNDTNAGTSGGPNDKVPPKVTVGAVPTKRGVVLRTKLLYLRVTSNERANYTILPIGNRAATRVAMRKQTRVLRISLTGSLLLRIQRARTRYVVVAVRVVGIDPNKNVTRRTIRLRVQR